MKRKSFTALFLSFAVTVSAVPTGSFADGNKFKDIKDTYWANDAINSLVNTGIFNGYPNGTFGPEDSMTREQFAAILFKAFELETTNVSGSTFKDVEPTRWSYGYIEAAKPYLTGYFPPSGKPSFDPNGIATREDVAVALVSVLNLNQVETGDPSDLDFKDTEEVSPKLRDEIALAVKYDLIKGFPDNTFRPDKPITRAQAASLIYKVLKSTYQEENANQAYSISVPARVSTPKVPIEVKMPKNTVLYINDTLVEDESTYYKKTWTIESGVGEKQLVFKLVLPSGKIVKETKTVIYETVTPDIYLEALQERTSEEYLLVKGIVYHKDDLSTTLYLNDKKMSYNASTGRFEFKTKLVSGENKLTFRVTNQAGKSYQVTKTVYYTPVAAEAPQILISNLPDKSNTFAIEYQVKVTDKYDRYVDLYINDAKQTIQTNRDYTVPMKLVKGDNKLVFKVTNSKGKQAVIERHVMMAVAAPNVEMTSATTTNYQDYELVLKVSDPNYKYSALTATVNGRKVAVDYRGYVKYDMDLNQGANLINVEVTNPEGVVTKNAYQVTYQVKAKAAPTLNVYVPEATGLTSGASITITGNVYDPEDTAVKVIVNGEAVTVSRSGNFSKALTVLTGDNVILVKATNRFGIVTEIKKIMQIK